MLEMDAAAITCEKIQNLCNTTVNQLALVCAE